MPVRSPARRSRNLHRNASWIGTPLVGNRRYRMPALPRRFYASPARINEPRRPSPREIVADEGVAVGGIIPQAPVELKRLTEVEDMSTGVACGRPHGNG